MNEIDQKMKITKEDYSTYVESKAQKSPLFKNMLLAFLIGGIICCIGQVITMLCMGWGLDKITASTVSTITLIALGAILTGLKLYNKLGKFAGAGSIVPITGFSNSIVSPAIEYKSEGFVLGLGANMFKVAGPVLVYGITSSVLVGIIYWLVKFVI